MSKMKTTVDIELSVKQIAEAFCGLDAGAQASFFEECADIATGTFHGGNFGQWTQVGKAMSIHPRGWGRNMVNSIAFEFRR